MGDVRGKPRGRTRRAAAAALGVVAVLTSALTAAAAVPAAAGSPASPGLAPHVYPGGGIIGFGNAAALGPAVPAPLSSVMVAMAADPSAGPADQGLWLASADGGVFTQGSARFFGSTGALALQGPIVAMAATPDGAGYWLAGLDGGVFAFGDAAFFGSMGGIPLNEPIVGLAATPDGQGYWLVAADGGIFAFGDAAFAGSMGGRPLVAPVTGMAPAPDGQGYWLVAADGGIFAFGAAPFYGSIGGAPLNDPVVGMAATHSGQGYVFVATDGGVFTFGDARFAGSLGGGYLGDPRTVLPVTGIALTPDDGGYWLLDPDGWHVGFTNPPAPAGLRAAIVAAAESQVGADPVPGSFCNPFGPCEPWCSLFVTWAWQQAGVPVPSLAFTGDLYDWAAATTAVADPTAQPLPGDAVLYGTGPASVDTSLHVGIVAQVWPDGAVVTIEGDAGPAPTGSLGVILNGPFLPARSAAYNGMPVYGFARP